MEKISNKKTLAFDAILKGLMDRYQSRVPEVIQIIQAMQDAHIIQSISDIENDHIAFRTLGLPHLGISSLEKIFLHYGYQRMDLYYFEQKHLNAYWYAPPLDRLPRIFISELIVSQLSKTNQSIIDSYTRTITKDPLLEVDFSNPAEVDQWLHQSLWALPSLTDYLNLARESEYAAWVIYNRYYLNHFTISVHNLPSPYNNLNVFNNFIEDLGISLNDAGGKIKTSQDGLLSQSSTVAGQEVAIFRDGGTKNIPGSYVEFAFRDILPTHRHLSEQAIKRHHRRDGFEALNADKIFESTFTSQVNKKK